MKVKININTHLFFNKIDAISYFSIKKHHYKANEWLHCKNINSCGENCQKECSLEGGHNEDEEKLFETTDIFEIENIILVQINSRGDLVWTAEFEKIYENN